MLASSDGSWKLWGISDIRGKFDPADARASSGVASRTETLDLPLAVEYSMTDGTALYSLFGPKVVGVLMFGGTKRRSPVVEERGPSFALVTSIPRPEST